MNADDERTTGRRWRPARERRLPADHDVADGSERPWTHRGYLPHCQTARLQAVTYRLADALPAAVVADMAAKLATVPDDERERERRRRIEVLLDAGHGACLLRDPRCAAIVIDNWRHFDGQRYHLHAWTVMPNHVHVLIEPVADWPLARIVHGWKSYTANRIARHVAIAGRRPRAIWQREYWDRYIRDERHYHQCVAYIEGNPVAAGLCDHPEAWPFSSAHPGAPAASRHRPVNGRQAAGAPRSQP